MRPKEQRAKARALFVFDGLDRPAVAARLRIPEGTITNWARADKQRGDDWNKARSAHGLAGSREDVARSILTLALRQADAMSKMIESGEYDPESKVRLLASLADSMSKMVRASAHLAPVADKLAVETAAVKRLAELFVKECPADGEKMVRVLESFAQGQTA